MALSLMACGANAVSSLLCIYSLASPDSNVSMRGPAVPQVNRVKRHLSLRGQMEA
jgi:hypothetical protein